PNQFAALGGHTTSYQYDGLGRVKEIDDANSGALQGITKYTYDNNGNVTEMDRLLEDKVVGGVEQKTWATTTYHYDSRNNLTDEFAPADAAGHVAQTHYEYDTANHLLSVKAAFLTPQETTTSWTYDGAGRKTSMTAPDGGLTTYQYDVVGNLIAET